MTLCREAFVMSHVLYADDIIISCKGTKNNIRCVLSNFNDYGAASGQIINKRKSRKQKCVLSNFNDYGATPTNL
jgi:hypothetical protein